MYFKFIPILFACFLSLLSSSLLAKPYKTMEVLYNSGDASAFRKAGALLTQAHKEAAHDCLVAAKEQSDLDEEFYYLQMARDHQRIALQILKTTDRLARKLEFHRTPPSFEEVCPWLGGKNAVFYGESIDTACLDIRKKGSPLKIKPTSTKKIAS